MCEAEVANKRGGRYSGRMPAWPRRRRSPADGMATKSEVPEVSHVWPSGMPVEQPPAGRCRNRTRTSVRDGCDRLRMACPRVVSAALWVRNARRGLGTLEKQAGPGVDREENCSWSSGFFVFQDAHRGGNPKAGRLSITGPHCPARRCSANLARSPLRSMMGTFNIFWALPADLCWRRRSCPTRRVQEPEAGQSQAAELNPIANSMHETPTTARRARLDERTASDDSPNACPAHA